MAFQQFPSFNFNESNVGPRPVRTASVDRIGLVGMFKRGPLTPQIVDAETAKMLYGQTVDVGSAHLQAMIDQGADSFLVNRVLGAAVTASYTATVVGTASGAGTLDVAIKNGTTTVTATVNLAGTETGSQVVALIVAAVNSLGTNTFVTAAAGASNSGTNGQIVFSARTEGVAGNANQFKFTLTTTTGLTFGPGTLTTFTNLAGGVDGPKAASFTVKDASNANVMLLTVNWPGASSNDVTGSLVEGSDTGLVSLILEYAPEGIKEVFHDIDLTDLFDEDKLAFLRSSVLASGQLIDGTKAPALGAITFTGGDDGPAVTTSDFIAGVDVLKDYQCSFLTCPGIKPAGVDQDAINTVMIAQAEALDVDMGEAAGLRIAVISAPRGMKVADIATLKSAGSIPNSKRCVMVVGWATIARLPKFKRFGIDPAALYSAKALVTPIQVSLAARTSSPQVVGITEVDTPIGAAAWNEITKARMDAIVLDQGQFQCLNGRTTSSDAAWYWTCYRRVYDKIRQDIWLAFQFVKSEPNTHELDNIVENTANGYLMGLMNDRVIGGYNPAVSNDVNNPPAIRAAGKRYVDFGIEMIPPNDFTQFNLNRVLTASVRLA